MSPHEPPFRPVHACGLHRALFGPEPTAGQAEPGRAAAASGIEQGCFDHSVRVQDDLFRHVNGGWLKHTAIPADRASTGAFMQIHDRIQDQLLALIDEAAAGGQDGEARQIGDLYASFMDEAAIEARGLAPLQAELAAVAAIADRTQFGAWLAEAVGAGLGTPLALHIGQDDRDSTHYVPFLSQGGLGLPDRDYYLVDDARFGEVRAQYRAHMATMLALAGESAAAAEAAAQAVLALETGLARAQWSRVENRDPVKTYNRCDVAALRALAPAIDWDGFAERTGLAGRAEWLVVGQPSYLAALSARLADTPLATWKAYATLRVLYAYAPFLDRKSVV